jgi:hypothetical protein
MARPVCTASRKPGTTAPVPKLLLLRGAVPDEEAIVRWIALEMDSSGK